MRAGRFPTLRHWVENRRILPVPASSLDGGASRHPALCPPSRLGVSPGLRRMGDGCSFDSTVAAQRLACLSGGTPATRGCRHGPLVGPWILLRANRRWAARSSAVRPFPHPAGPGSTCPAHVAP